jgi:hypothetical protein
MRLARCSHRLTLSRRFASQWWVAGIFWVLLALPASSCRKSDAEGPESVVREMIDVTRAGNAARAYALVAPQSQQRLQEMAKLATAQTGGQRTIEPHELLAVSLDPVRHRLARVEIVEQTAERARVRLTAAKGQVHEDLELVQVAGRWRIVLPERVFRRPSTTGGPASAPASAPAKAATSADESVSERR